MSGNCDPKFNPVACQYRDSKNNCVAPHGAECPIPEPPDMAHQDHYEQQPVQPIEAIMTTLTREQVEGFLMGNVIKYSMRAGRKAGTDDLAKVRVYRQWLREWRESGCIKQFSEGKK